MSKATTFGNLIAVKTVVANWQGLKAENVERWRDIVIGRGTRSDASRMTQRPDGFLVAGFLDKLTQSLQWQSEEPPEFEFHTGIGLTEKQRRDFNRGNTEGVQSTVKELFGDLFGALLRPPSFQDYKGSVAPSRSHFAVHHWHRDPAEVVAFVTNTLPTKLLRGDVPANFSRNPPQHRGDLIVSIGQSGDSMIETIDGWAAKNDRLVAMHTNEIVIDVGRSWHRPDINKEDRPIPRVFMRGAASITPRAP